MKFNTIDHNPDADVRMLPAYSVPEAAQYLHMAAETLRTWVTGRWYPAAGQRKRFRPLIQLDDPQGKFLSFINLVEAHVLAAIRRRHGIKLPNVRSALEYVQRHHHIERPLIDQSFQTDGLDLFVEHYGKLINASREGQEAMKEIIGVYLKRIDRDANGLPIRFYPFTRDNESDAAPKLDPKVVVMNPAISFGRPVIAGTGIPVSAIYERYKAGDSIAELAQNYNLDTSAIEEAIRCEAA
jgi:uncharacterized protein (DUF433 family)